MVVCRASTKSIATTLLSPGQRWGLLCACAGIVGLLASCSGAIDERGELVLPHAAQEAGEPSDPGSDGTTRSSSPPRSGGDEPNGPAEAPGVSFACTSDAPSDGEPATLRRLTMAQYAATLRDLIAWAVPGEADHVMRALEGALADLPEDQREPTPEDLHGSYRRLDQSLQQAHVDAIFALSRVASAELTVPSRLGALAGACATDADPQNDAACLDDFIARFGSRALRRPLDADDLAFYRSVYGAEDSGAAGYADVIATMLNAPEMVYLVEHGDAEVPGQPGTYTLSAYELASRLSYQLWQSMPDHELFEAAADGSLLDPDVYAEQVERMLQDPRAAAGLDEFLADWIKAEDLPELDTRNQDPVFAAFAADDLPGPDLREAMIDDAVSMLRYYTWVEPAPVSTWLTSDASFARDEALAAIYGVAPWDGESAPPQLPQGQRPGLFTRALFLATGTANTRPIMKGVFLRKQVLCDTIPPPPPGANAMPPELRPDMTTREVVEELTETPGTVCAGCHTTLINPLGFATENFDALGRFRTEQRLFADDGEELAPREVDTRVVAQVGAGQGVEVAGAAELMALIAESGKVEACLARNYFRFTHARWEDAERDGCALEAMRTALAEGGNMTDLIRVTVESEEFRRRRFE